MRTLREWVFGVPLPPRVYDDETKGQKLVELTDSDQIQWKWGDNCYYLILDRMHIHFYLGYKCNIMGEDNKVCDLDISRHCLSTLFHSILNQEERLVNNPIRAKFWESLRNSL